MNNDLSIHYFHHTPIHSSYSLLPHHTIRCIPYLILSCRTLSFPFLFYGYSLGEIISFSLSSFALSLWMFSLSFNLFSSLYYSFLFFLFNFLFLFIPLLLLLLLLLIRLPLLLSCSCLPFFCSHSIWHHRKYTNGSVLRMHVDTVNTHVVSAIINVDQQIDEEVNHQLLLLLILLLLLLLLQ